MIGHGTPNTQVVYGLTRREMQLALDQHRKEIASMVRVSPAEKAIRFADNMPACLADMFDPLYTPDNIIY